ncbi:sphingomyelin phosphodiesterase 2a [Engraulis encrasicolus]|uniref:sphingomyelin phosphodiesterase 2a n=1 Tax=Engraulis encrasicolus TaxID=184585 RepID=UPI002FD1543D
MSAPHAVRMRVFSLNCWGIRHLSRHCAQRYQMLAEMLDREQHDIALLQEVWSESDYLFLKQALTTSYPFSYYFRSGVIGSGLAVLSKHRIEDALLYQYSLNGYPYMIHHGDWFGGKAVGLVVMDVCGMKAHVYVTHLHAEYSRAKDDYLPHRTVQSWELLNFIRHTSADADLVVLGGDLNMHPQDLGTRLLRAHTGLRDCYVETDTFDGCEDGITLIDDNPFTKKKDLLPFEKGIRIDYILMKGSDRVCVRCESMSTTKGCVPDKPFPYSDHESLTIQLLLQRTGCMDGVRHTQRYSTSDTDTPAGERVEVVKEARGIVQDGLHQTERGRLLAMCMLGLGLALLLLPAGALPWFYPHGHCPLSYALLGLMGALGIALVVCGALLYVLFTTQLKALSGAEDGMKMMMGSLRGGSGACWEEEGGDGEATGAGAAEAERTMPASSSSVSVSRSSPHGGARFRLTTPLDCEE